MALQNILNKAVAIDLSESKTLYRAVSNGGVGRTLSASPLFYYIDVETGPMYRDDYTLIQTDLRELDYGVEIVEASLPHGFTYTANTISTAPTVDDLSPAGTTIGVATGHNLSVGDWIQFTYSDFTERGARKVYQIASATATSVTLNTGLIKAPANGSDIIHGSNVVFRLIATELASATTVPGRNGQPFYSYNGTFQFREVL